MNTLFKLSIPHKVAFWLSWNGFRGSSIYWSIALLLSKFFENRQYQLPSGFILKSDSKDWTSRTIYQGTYERALIKFLYSYQFSGMYIDVGANIGSTLFSALYENPDATYVAFEPSIQCHEALQVLQNNLQQVGKIEKCAVGSHSGFGELFGSNNLNHSGAASLLNLRNSVPSQSKVKIISLDEYLSEQFGTLDLDIAILKVDTEGFEKEVVEGAINTLKTSPVGILILEISPSFSDTSWVTTLSATLGSRYTWFELTEKSLLKKKPYLKSVTEQEVIKSTHHFNLVLVRHDRLNHLPI